MQIPTLLYSHNATWLEYEHELKWAKVYGWATLRGFINEHVQRFSFANWMLLYCVVVLPFSGRPLPSRTENRTVAKAILIPSFSLRLKKFVFSTHIQSSSKITKASLSLTLYFSFFVAVYFSFQWKSFFFVWMRIVCLFVINTRNQQKCIYLYILNNNKENKN